VTAKNAGGRADREYALNVVPDARLKISNLVAKSNGKYEAGELHAGELRFADRPYEFKAVGAYGGMSYIRGANDDKGKLADDFLSFEVNLPVTVYVAYEEAAAQTPKWLAGWSRADQGPDAKLLAGYRVYARDFAAGKVALGGNGTEGMSGSIGFYTAIINRKGGVAARLIAGPEALRDAVLGRGYRAAFTATGPAPIRWIVTAGAPPPGMNLDNATGLYSGTPTATGTYEFIVTAASPVGNDQRTYVHAVHQPNAHAE
jgi:hypothetical protein